MRLLLDTCVWGPAAETLRNGVHDVVWAGNWAEDPGDGEILATAYAEERILITLDKDFGELAVRQKVPHHGILRIIGFPAKRQADACLAILKSSGNELFAGAIVTAQPGRSRIRPPDDAESDHLEATE